MRPLGETLPELARALRETPLEAGQASRLQEIAKRLHRLPPGRERDGLLAVVYLRLHQLLGREEHYLRGYSYARTARLEPARLWAERLGERG
ncbi:hypothetical protein [Thermus thermamylovorans]|uniref:Uncharacterized protein n=1 Tax=Thermus thermamylovorans TaxID=2509362 RepID=A0A4Q9B7E5_9DEIN|nr:hypothetical protein [Thermus thermamylovorans]TBH21732.1 hypothetical protein ETP66_00375 [Thermus thermamylovorans]